MNAPTFTTKPERVARLQFNYDEGARREKIPAAEREQMDKQLLRIDSAYLEKLFANVAAIRKARKGSPENGEMETA